MAILDVQTIPVNGGLVPVPVAADVAGDEAPVGGGRLLWVELAAAATAGVTATVATPGTVKGLGIEDVVHTLAAGEVWLLPLTAEFRGANGRAAITYDSVTNLSVAVLEPER